jgi:hypothetical protein
MISSSVCRNQVGASTRATLSSRATLDHGPC